MYEYGVYSGGELWAGPYQSRDKAIDYIADAVCAGHCSDSFYLVRRPVGEWEEVDKEDQS